MPAACHVLTRQGELGPEERVPAGEGLAGPRLWAVSFSGMFDGSGSSASDQTRRLAVVHEERRRTVDSRTIAAATLACARCDAPVALAPGGHAPAAPLTCPFCAHRAPLREFLSLAAPIRPARVLVKLRAVRSR